MASIKPSEENTKGDSSSQDGGPSQNTRFGLSRPALHQDKQSDNMDTDLTRSPKNRRKLDPQFKGKSLRLYPALDGVDGEDKKLSDGDADDMNRSRDDVYDNDSSNQSALDSPSHDDTTDVKQPHVRQRGRPATPKGRNKGKKAPQTSDDTTDAMRENQAFWCWLGLGVLVAIVVVGLIARCYIIVFSQPGMPNEDPVTPRVNYFNLFKPSYDDLKQKFPSQTMRFWKVVGTPLKRVLSESSPAYPAVIMLGVADGQSKLGTCLAKRVALQVNNVFELDAGDGYINAEDLVQTSGSKAKLELDDKLKSVLTAGQVVVIDHLEKLHPTSALLLHAYCDGDNAPFKNATVILVVHSDQQFADTTERSIEQFLSAIWQPSLGVDETPALRSRVANNVAVVTPETQSPEHCEGLVRE